MCERTHTWIELAAHAANVVAWLELHKAENENGCADRCSRTHGKQNPSGYRQHIHCNPLEGRKEAAG
jgi:hypothetical protein